MNAVFDRFDIIVVPFPFTDRPVARRRPALVVSGMNWNIASGHIVCAMITSARQSAWPLDAAVTNLTVAGLVKPCVVRMKLFTIEATLVFKRAGSIADDDRGRVEASLDALRI